MDNPYSSPQTGSPAEAGEPGPLSPQRERLANLGEVFVAWEWLRIWYNVALASVALLSVMLLDPALLVNLGSLETMVLSAIGANGCFLAGPLVEGYVTWWWRPVKGLRECLFYAGTFGSILLTLLVVLFLSHGGS